MLVDYCYYTLYVIEGTGITFINIFCSKSLLGELIEHHLWMNLWMTPLFKQSLVSGVIYNSTHSFSINGFGGQITFPNKI